MLARCRWTQLAQLICPPWLSLFQSLASTLATPRFFQRGRHFHNAQICSMTAAWALLRRVVRYFGDSIVRATSWQCRDVGGLLLPHMIRMRAAAPLRPRSAPVNAWCLPRNRAFRRGVSYLTHFPLSSLGASSLQLIDLMLVRPFLLREIVRTGAMRMRGRCCRAVGGYAGGTQEATLLTMLQYCLSQPGARLFRSFVFNLWEVLVFVIRLQ